MSYRAVAVVEQVLGIAAADGLGNYIVAENKDSVGIADFLKYLRIASMIIRVDEVLGCRTAGDDRFDANTLSIISICDCICVIVGSC